MSKSISTFFDFLLEDPQMQAYVPRANPKEAKAQVVSVFETFGTPPLVALIERLRSGGFDGSSTKFDFLSTIAEPIGSMPKALADRLNFHKKSPLEPIECFTFNIQIGNTPLNNERARTVVEWCEKLLSTHSVSEAC